jgi:hypothetical protein
VEDGIVIIIMAAAGGRRSMWRHCVDGIMVWKISRMMMPSG